MSEEPAAPSTPATPGAEPPPAVPWRWTDALLVLALVFLSGVVVLPLVESLGAYGNVALVIVSAILTAGLTIGVARKRYGDAARLLWGHRRPTALDALVGVAAAVAGYVGVTLIVVLLTAGGRAPEVQESLRQAAADPRTLPIMALGAVILVPIAEELLYRGMLFQGLRDRYGRWPAIGLSGFVFGLLHVQWGDLGGTLLLLAAFYPFGMWLAWLFDRRGSLVAPLVCHMLYNGGNLALFLSGR
ncbi:MAG TPA: CPBP family intramembrane glutamic endopeptidase [Egibacteraceae bacterium]|nr:CPBP family intramembrane glutamic endopeptidase [Egibacteraceae bacterium]